MLIPNTTVAQGGDPSGEELSYAQITSDLTVNGSSGSPNTVVTGGSITLDGVTDIYIEFYTPGLVAGSADLVVEAFENSTSLGRLMQVLGGEGQFPAFGSMRRTPTAGVHTYSIKAWKNGGTDGVINAGGGVYVPAFMRVMATAAAGVADNTPWPSDPLVYYLTVR